MTAYIEAGSLIYVNHSKTSLWKYFVYTLQSAMLTAFSDRVKEML